jgi:hypothetical protein
MGHAARQDLARVHLQGRQQRDSAVPHLPHPLPVRVADSGLAGRAARRKAAVAGARSYAAT